LLRDTSTLSYRWSPGIEPATFLLPDNRSYLLSYCRPKEAREERSRLVELRGEVEEINGEAERDDKEERMRRREEEAMRLAGRSED